MFFRHALILATPRPRGTLTGGPIVQSIFRQVSVNMKSRSRRFWEGFRRGAKFGAICGLIIWMFVNAVLAVLLLVVPELRARALAEFEKMSALAALGNFIFPILLMVVYGAVPGAIIMGLASVLRANRDESVNSN